jgi:ubiquinone/menaquinone biosynthesis C-methylase UbiE
MLGIKNWDNKTWISSREYIKSFNNFIIKQKKLNKESKILDIGCGRGKIIGTLSSKLRLINKPIGVDIEKHKDVDKRIIFKRINAIKYLKNNKKNFDLILIKQTIHLFNDKEIRKILDYAYSNLNINGVILILSLDPKNNEIPTFTLMAKKLQISFNKEAIIKNNILKFMKKKTITKFNFKVNIKKRIYINMIKQRYISSLLSLKNDQILRGIKEINIKYKSNIIFKDKLNCVIFKKIKN